MPAKRSKTETGYGQFSALLLPICLSTSDRLSTPTKPQFGISDTGLGIWEAKRNVFYIANIGHKVKMLINAAETEVR